MADPRLADAIRDLIVASGSRFAVHGGEPFAALTETDLVDGLRARGWRLPPTSFFLSEVRSAGIQTRQAYLFPGGKVRRVFRDGTAGRTLQRYSTLIYFG